MNETLKRLLERFPVEEIATWGRCLIVPTKEFTKQYDEELTKEGFRIRYQGWSGQTCAFIGPIKTEIETPVQKTEVENKTATPWTPEDDALLKKLLGQLPHREIAEKLGRTKTAIDQRVITLNLTSRRPRFWTDKEDCLLKELHGKIPYSAIAEKLDRSKHAIAARVTTLGLNEQFSKTESLPGLALEPREKIEEKKPENADVRVKELLAASSVLYPEYRTAAALLLREAAREIEAPI